MKIRKWNILRNAQQFMRLKIVMTQMNNPRLTQIITSSWSKYCCDQGAQCTLLSTLHVLYHSNIAWCRNSDCKLKIHQIIVFPDQARRPFQKIGLFGCLGLLCNVINIQDQIICNHLNIHLILVLTFYYLGTCPQAVGKYSSKIYVFGCSILYAKSRRCVVSYSPRRPVVQLPAVMHGNSY